jgi:hypothetical protein
MPYTNARNPLRRPALLLRRDLRIALQPVLQVALPEPKLAADSVGANTPAPPVVPKAALWHGQIISGRRHAEKAVRSP